MNSVILLMSQMTATEESELRARCAGLTVFLLCVIVLLLVWRGKRGK